MHNHPERLCSLGVREVYLFAFTRGLDTFDVVRDVPGMDAAKRSERVGFEPPGLWLDSVS
jgi:hypothetical protein